MKWLKVDILEDCNTSEKDHNMSKDHRLTQLDYKPSQKEN